MSKRIIQVMTLLAAICIPLRSQISLDKDEYQAGRYRLNFSNHGYAYTIGVEDGRRVIRFHVPYDEGHEAVPVLPRKDLFIALPAGTRSTVTFTPVRQTAIMNVTPVLTPRVQQENDSTVVYSPATDMSDEGMATDAFYRFKGFLWIGGNYCAHITVFPYLYDAAMHQVVELNEFRIEMETPSAVTRSLMKATAAEAIAGLIVNREAAAGWSSAHPGNTVRRTDDWIDYGQDYLKIGTAHDGIYRLTYDDLVRSGVPASGIDPRALKLYLNGREIPIYVGGENNNAFNPGDYIEFLGRRNYGDVRYREPADFGTPYHEYLNRYSDTTIYWLSWSGGFGKRTDTVLTLQGTPTDTTAYYDELIHLETDNYWDFSLSGGDVRKNSPYIFENETWNEGNLGVGTVQIPFTIDNLVPGKPARAFVKLQDYSSSIDRNAHDLALSINGDPTRYDSGYINKYQVKTLTASFSSSGLRNGTNNVTIQSFAVPTNTVNAVIRDWYELEYPRALNVSGSDSLQFAYRSPVAHGLTVYRITGLPQSPLSLYRFIWKDSATVKITNYTRDGDTLRFVDSLAEGRTYFLAGENRAATPFVFYKKRFVNLRNPSTQADYIAITHPYFKTAAAAYTSFIASSYGVTTKLVDVNDIFDEFSYGNYTAESIRDFLQSAHQAWQSPKPEYVFLIGKTTYDFYGNKHRNFGAPAITNFVPSYGNPVSDTWYVIWDSTGAMIPQMSIGRIPAKNLDEFQYYFSKHQKYLTKGYDEWNKRYIFFSGGNFTDPDQLAQSKAVNDAIITQYVAAPPISGLYANFYKTANPISNFGPYPPSYISGAIEQGGLFISYIGHSGTQTWDNSITDVAQLANIRDRNPLITDFGCSTGKFAEPDVLSFSELATNDLKGQAIAYIGNSSLGFTTTAYTFPQVFYKKLLVDTTVSVGETHRLAKSEYIHQYGASDVMSLFVMTNTLLGDPIIKLPIPQKPNFTLLNTTFDLTPQRPTEQTDTLHVAFSYNNFGRAQEDSVDILVTDDYQAKTQFSKLLRRPVPGYADTITIGIPVQSMPGEHRLSVHIDPSNRIDEISKTDNALSTIVVVASSSTRSLSLSPVLNQMKGELTYLNPSIRTGASELAIEVSPSPLFTPSRLVSVPFDTFFTKITLDPSFAGKRVWVRTKNEAENTEGLTYSYWFGNESNILLNDSVSLSRMALSGMKLFPSGVSLDTAKIEFTAISAGFSDGRTAVVLKNGQNYIPENTIRGHHVVLFDATTYEYAGYFRFDVLSGGVQVTNYKTFLDTLSSKYLVAIAVCDEGYSNLDEQLKSEIRQLGSRFIDSLTFRGSWAIIGRKGAAPGTVPEQYTAPFGGRVQIDTTISIPNTVGTFATEPIGPVAAWKNAVVRYTRPAGSNVRFTVVGFKADNSTDTLLNATQVDSTIDLASVNAKQYPLVKLVGNVGRAQGQTSPLVRSIAVNYDALAELGTNYQAVGVSLDSGGSPGREIASGDTVVQGEKILLKYRVYNVGGTVARKFGVQTDAIWDNNSIEPLTSAVVDSLPPLSYREFSAVYNTALGFGRRSLRVTIDPDTLVRELYRDNNIYALPIYVKKDSSKPLLPNLYITQTGIFPLAPPVTDENDSAGFAIVYGNSGAFIGDSVTIAVRQFYKGVNVASWILRRKYPPGLDTVTINVPILKRAGEHQLQVELDPVGLIVESSKSDNTASYYFTVATTDFKILQPAAFSTGAAAKIIFLNPTTLVGASRTADLEIDSLTSFPAPRKYQIAMQQFTTSADISTLPGSRRYYWRIRQDQSGRDWTTGSFYLGASSEYSLGRNDSTGWKSDIFMHAAYDTSGAHIVDTRTVIRAVSAGFSDGRTGSINVNGVNVITPVFGTGHNCVVIDTNTYSVAARRRFDISNDASQADSLIQFLASVVPGSIVVDIVVDEGANNLTPAARDALRAIGSARIDSLSRRDSWAIIGRKGAAQGTVPESYVPQFGGSASVETTFVKKEFSGTITTQAFGPLSKMSAFSMSASIPVGTSVQTTFIGSRFDGRTDTLPLTSGTALSNSNLQNFANYQEGRIVFNLQASVAASPVIASWKLSTLPVTELAVSEQTASVNRTQVMEGEPIVFSGTVYNVSAVPAESVTVQLSTNENGFERILKSQTYASIPGNDSVVLAYTYSSRGKRGAYAFTLNVDPADSVVEVSKDNNTVSVPFTVQADTLRPQIQVVVDGEFVLDGDYIRQNPEIVIRYSDNNPTIISVADTANFRIRLNNNPVYFAPGMTELIPSTTPGQAQLKWTPTLPGGENYIQIYALDVSGNSSDTTTLFVNVSTEFTLKDIYNLPNPFANSTSFTFNLLSPVPPDEVSIKVFTVAGRLIQDLTVPGRIGFNQFNWNGRDKDGDELGNGVYFYKVIVKQGNKQTNGVSKLVKMR